MRSVLRAAAGGWRRSGLPRRPVNARFLQLASACFCCCCVWAGKRHGASAPLPAAAALYGSTARWRKAMAGMALLSPVFVARVQSGSGVKRCAKVPRKVCRQRQRSDF
ncbi:hypothetical protein NPIL_576791 [Nephila pilipes]|uniref:Uncharacterized protein n=1 Tax=Nephila pilipes TaxID=299642 RepID=A0A8X6T8Q9_NEPPI|nr:hypothetical protein NPIL_576791 [Nephila pilipes]